jgi:predicted enzyme related to lactoylglutathione lyase
MISWFEIAVNDMPRAKKFYEDVFDIKIQVMDFGGTLMGWFPNTDGSRGTSGSLVQNSNYTPSKAGSLVYFKSSNIQVELDRIKITGGEIVQQKTKISEEYGFMAVFIDSEGNRVALHSEK